MGKRQVFNPLIPPNKRRCAPPQQAIGFPFLGATELVMPGFVYQRDFLPGAPNTTLDHPNEQTQGGVFHAHQELTLPWVDYPVQYGDSPANNMGLGETNFNAASPWVNDRAQDGNNMGLGETFLDAPPLAFRTYHPGTSCDPIEAPCCNEFVGGASELSTEETPEALINSLHPHQMQALWWMKRKEKSRDKGGILADDMGLGKTVAGGEMVR